ncbi:MAG: 5'-nucleotidase, lipoprotein e(P4) family [Dokdonella sp.]
MSRFSLALAAVLISCSGCAAKVLHEPATTASVDTTLSAVVAANDNLNAVAWTQTAIERELVYRQAYRSAQAHLAKALADPSWEALPSGERKSSASGLRPAIIVDVDETVLDNSPYQARLVRAGSSYNEATWAAWCREQRAAAIPGALEFTRYAASSGVTVFYLTNRAQDLRDDTLANLRKLGFPVDADDVFVGLGTVVSGCDQESSEKGCRRELISRSHRVLMQVGDQIGDFVDTPLNTLEGRRAAVKPYFDWIGERWFVLPNPTYGSWEPALFDNNRRLPAEQQRAMARAALRVE